MRKEDRLKALRKIYCAMLAARLIDEIENRYTLQGKAFFHVSGAGHEAVAALTPHLIPSDWLHCHYRDKALMLARGLQPKAFFDSLFCNSASHSQGRQMNAHMCAAELNILSIVGPVGNNALQAVGIAMAVKSHQDKPIVLSAMGDGSTQQGEVLEAIAEAVRSHLPVLFFIENNRYSISTQTPGNTFFSLPNAERAASFYGIAIHYINGQDAAQAYAEMGPVIHTMRETRQPAIVVFEVERLSSHTNADEHTIYRQSKELERIQQADPVKILAEHLTKQDIAAAALNRLEAILKCRLEKLAKAALKEPPPVPIFTAKKPLPDFLQAKAEEYNGNGEKQLNLREAICGVLRQKLADPSVQLFGEDIEDPKGDVFGVTRGLSEDFPEQVKNSPLAEATIVGSGIGRCLAGQKAVVFLQFADFLPLAFNQIASELGSLHWRTNGQWQAPVIVMIACGAYRPGLGPFHAQSGESISAHIPGIDVMMPATAGDAAGLLNAAFQSGRPTLFFYPKSCLNSPEFSTSDDLAKHIVPIGKARFIRQGNDITIVAYGSVLSHCIEVTEQLEQAAFGVDLIDLRCISPWDKASVIASVAKTKRLLVIHEDNHSVSLSSEILATMAEHFDHAIKMARVTRADTYIPCHYDSQLAILPSFKSILNAAANLLDREVIWHSVAIEKDQPSTIDAIGMAPSDETVVLCQWFVEVGSEIQEGDLISELEASKATYELLAPKSGIVAELLAKEGDTIAVGDAILKLETTETRVQSSPEEYPEIKMIEELSNNVPQNKMRPTYQVSLVDISTAEASRTVTNAELQAKWQKDIAFLTGIEQRQHIADGETVLSLSVKAAKTLLDKLDLGIDAIDMLLVSTGTPEIMSPSLACQILHQLNGQDSGQLSAQAYDIHAACSGYLYGLQNVYDFLQMQPDSRVLLITAEVMSPLLNPDDFSTSATFGDAATATLLEGELAPALKTISPRLKLKRPLLATLPESGELLNVPLPGTQNWIHMNGTAFFTEAVRKMALILERSCEHHNIKLEELDLVIPHQANKRIIDALRVKMKIPPDKMVSKVKNYGNTSSSSIPLALAEILSTLEANQNIGLCAFGGGFTFAAAIIST